MKTLDNHIILYDADCPLCSIYTKAFVNTGMLRESGRESYQQMPEQVCHFVDRQRAVNEIALVNSATGEVSYGIKSLFKVIGNAFPLFNPLFSFGPFSWIMSKIYAFISYNRRVIIPAKKTDPKAIQPTFILKHRIAYLVFTWLVTSIILTEYAQLLKPLLPVGKTYREFLICGGQVIFQGIIVSRLAVAKRWDYLGNMMTISFSGAMLLLPFILLARYLQIPPGACSIVFYGHCRTNAVRTYSQKPDIATGMVTDLKLDDISFAGIASYH